MIAIFLIVRYAIVARNMLAARLEARRSGELQEKVFQQDDGSDTWSGDVEIVRPEEARKQQSIC
jgi:hypothetical protein